MTSAPATTPAPRSPATVPVIGLALAAVGITVAFVATRGGQPAHAPQAGQVAVSGRTSSQPAPLGTMSGSDHGSHAGSDAAPDADADPGDMHAGIEGNGFPGAPLPVANLGVRDQSSDGTTLFVGDAEVNGTPGWVVVQRDDAGKPGTVVGKVRRLNGQHGSGVTVTLTTRVPSGRYWVTLHRDLGVKGRYEFPGPDAIARSGAQALVVPVTLTVR